MKYGLIAVFEYNDMSDNTSTAEAEADVIVHQCCEETERERQ